MWVHIMIELIVIGLFLVFGWAIRTKQQYGLLSGFNNRSEEEQKELIERGYPQKTGTLLIFTAVGMLLLFPLNFTTLPYVIEVQYGFMMIFLFGGMIYLSRYEVPSKQKKSLWLGLGFSFLIFGFIIVLFFIGYQPNELVVNEDTFEINGMYGDEWNLADIEKIEILHDMPEIHYKENGFGMENLSKGHFYVEKYGSSLLFIRHQAPYLLIDLKNKSIFINGKNTEQTNGWYEQLKQEKQ
ncbi:DUF3784 domain-containing protein [Niallia sp. Krafla_26]|uniref:DUF3784 domain-containing protein n=1 Tax=Niallia sp. Krafla_26 TaxID=3064703 RepID=UPI003D16FF83